MSDRKESSSVLGWVLRNILGIVVVFALVIGLSALALRLDTRHGKEIIVPDFTGKSVEEAGMLASGDNLRIDVVDSVYIRRMGRGLVYSQNPKPGSKVKSGRRILLTINSVTPKKVQMPNLVGYSMRQAKAELNSRGLMLRSLEYVDDIATNNVLKQKYGGREVKPGTLLDSGSGIDLVVGLSEDDNQTYIPDFTGLKYLRAVDAVHDHNLNVGKLVFDKGVSSYADSLDAVVYSQNPVKAEESVLMGTPVTLYLRLEGENE